MMTLGWVGTKSGMEYFVPDSVRWQWLAQGGAIHREMRAAGEIVHPQPIHCVQSYIESALPPSVSSTLLGSDETAGAAPLRKGRGR